MDMDEFGYFLYMEEQERRQKEEEEDESGEDQKERPPPLFLFSILYEHQSPLFRWTLGKPLRNAPFSAPSLRTNETLSGKTIAALYSGKQNIPSCKKDGRQPYDGRRKPA